MSHIIIRIIDLDNETGTISLEDADVSKIKNAIKVTPTVHVVNSAQAILLIVAD